jgi:hypothetical protein
MTPAINNNNKKASTKAQSKWDNNRSIPYPWKAGIYFCFALTTRLLWRGGGLQERHTSFRLSCREHMPAPTAAEGEKYIKGCTSIVDYYREELGGGKLAIWWISDILFLHWNDTLLLDHLVTMTWQF